MEHHWTPGAVRELRRSLGLTQQQLVVQLHVSVGTVARWEAGKQRPTPFLAHALQELARQSSG